MSAFTSEERKKERMWDARLALTRDILSKHDVRLNGYLSPEKANAINKVVDKMVENIFKE